MLKFNTLGVNSTPKVLLVKYKLIKLNAAYKKSYIVDDLLSMGESDLSVRYSAIVNKVIRIRNSNKFKTDI